jgi:hypothetical protein
MDRFKEFLEKYLWPFTELRNLNLHGYTLKEDDDVIEIQTLVLQKLPRLQYFNNFSRE